MAVPASGELSLGKIRQELETSDYSAGPYTANATSLSDSETGLYATINTNSPSYPDGTPPYIITDWYGYDHDALPASSDPNSITGCNCIGWYDFTDSSTITTSGADITSITNKATQGTPLGTLTSATGYEPQKGTGGQNGLDYADFNNVNGGYDGRMSLPANRGLANMTILYIMDEVAGLNLITSGPNVNSYVRLNNAGQPWLNISPSIIFVGGPYDSPGNFHMWGISRLGSTQVISYKADTSTYTIGSPVTTDYLGNPITANNFVLRWLGYVSARTDSPLGKLYEWLIFDGEIGAEFTTLVSYLQGKY